MTTLTTREGRARSGTEGIGPVIARCHAHDNPRLTSQQARETRIVDPLLRGAPPSEGLRWGCHRLLFDTSMSSRHRKAEYVGASAGIARRYGGTQLSDLRSQDRLT